MSNWLERRREILREIFKNEIDAPAGRPIGKPDGHIRATLVRESEVEAYKQDTGYRSPHETEGEDG